MDYDQVNDVLSRANADFERRELEDLRGYELEADDEPTVEALDRIERDSLGEDNPVDNSQGSGRPAAEVVEPVEPVAEPHVATESVDGVVSADEYMGYVAECATTIAFETGVSDDDALEALENEVAKLAAAGAMPPMPDIEVAAEQDLSSWLSIAKTGDLVAKAIETVNTGR